MLCTDSLSTAASADKLTNLQDDHDELFPHAGGVQLWLADPVAKRGCNKASVTEALLNTRLSVEGVSGLSIGLMDYDSANVSVVLPIASHLLETDHLGGFVPQARLPNRLRELPGHAGW